MSDISTPKHEHPVRLRWLFKMAWRDSRAHRRRLLLYMSSIILGTASLIAMRTLGDNMQRAIDDEAKALLGADLDINTRGIFNNQVEAYLLSLGGAQSRQIRINLLASYRLEPLKVTFPIMVCWRPFLLKRKKSSERVNRPW